MGRLRGGLGGDAASGPEGEGYGPEVEREERIVRQQAATE